MPVYEPSHRAGTRDTLRQEVDIYGPDYFPASDPPSSWWGGKHDDVGRPAPAEGVPNDRPD